MKTKKLFAAIAAAALSVCLFAPAAFADNVSGSRGATSITADTRWDLTGDVTLTGTITVKNGATLRIYNDDNIERTIKRAPGFTGDMFYVEAGGTLHINGDGSCYGSWDQGAIVVDGNAGVTATGQIIDCSGKLSLRDTVIRNNKGYNAIWLGGSGAGDPVDVYHYTTVEITRTLIEKCSATSGGGIVIAGSTPASYTVEIWDSMIYQCNAVDGSAIYFSSEGQARVLMKESVVDDCDQSDKYVEDSSGYYGGALRTNGNGRFKFTMTDSIVRNCDSWKFGGGIYWNASGAGSELTVTDCQFLNNAAAEMGGGMFLEGSDMTIGASAGTPTAAIASGMPGDNITGTLIQGNHAPNGGGISYKCYSNSAEVQVPTTVANFNENVIFKDNTGANGAALAYNLHDTHNYPTGATFEFNISGAQFTDNVGTGAGGAIYVYKCRTDYVLTVNFNSGTITSNKAKNGGAIAITTADGVTVGGTFNMKGGTLSNNTATANGGAVYLTNGSYVMSGGTVDENAANNGGSAYVTGGSYAMSGGTVKNNTSAANGGAVYVAGGSFTMSGGAIQGNTAKGNGGGVYVSNGSYVMTDGSVIGNEAVNGGAAYMDGGDFTMEHGVVNDNDASGNGGAVYMASASATFKMESGQMNGNEAKDDGGAICAAGGAIYIGLNGCNGSDSDLSKHTAKGDGRHHPQISGNEAKDTGGGIAIANEGVVHFYCGEATGNTALYKGVGKNVFMDGGVFNLYDGAKVGAPRDHDLVIVGGTLNNACEESDKYVKLNYHMTNGSTETNMTGFAEYGEVMNLPDGEYFWPIYAEENGLAFIGWTAQGAVSDNQDDEYVRHKEQYLDSGDPVEILDRALVDTSDETGENTAKVFDGTEDETMHLYALWAPLTSDITYVDNVTWDVMRASSLPASYTFSREENVVEIGPAEKPGYRLAGWYIYQDEGQNANWSPDADMAYEPDPDGTDPDGAAISYETLRLDGLVYWEVDASGVLRLQAGGANFGDITLIANYVPQFGTLTIDKAFPVGSNYSIDENQSFVFHVLGNPDDESLEDFEMDVVVTGDGSVTIAHLPVGEYTVTEEGAWSWRYLLGGVTASRDSAATPSANGIEFTLTADAERVTFANTRDYRFWLSGDSYAENWWGPTTVEPASR